MAKKKFYAVALGIKPGIYTEWSECEQQINGFKGAKFKGFKTREEAETYIASNAPKAKENATTKKRKKSNIHITIHFDGGSRGNGRNDSAGSGALLQIIDSDKKEKEIVKLCKYLCDVHANGKTLTNNYAEYTALIIGLNEVRIKNLVSEGAKLDIFGDSMLVINQLSGLWECRAENILHLYKEAKGIIKEFKEAGMILELTHVYRNQNTEADALANEAMDSMQSSSNSTVTTTFEEVDV